MKDLLDPLFELSTIPLLLLRKNGCVEKANKAAMVLWPVLQENNGIFLWQLDKKRAQQTKQLFLLQQEAPDTPALSIILSPAQKDAAAYQLQLLSQNAEHLLLKAEKHKPLKVELPEASALSLEFVHTILNAMPDQMMAVLDADMRYLAFNQAYQQEYARIFAVDINPGDLVMDTIQHLPEEQEKARQIWEQVKKGEGLRVTETFGHTSLQPTTYRLSFFPLEDSKGNFLGALYRVKNISIEQQNNIDLPDSEKRFRTLAEHSTDIVVRFSPELHILYANTTAAEETGVMHTDLVDRNVFETPIIRNIPESYILKIKQTFESGQEHDLISTYDNEGVLKNFFNRFVPETNAAGDVVSVIAVSRNISDLQEAQRELQVARDFVFMADIMPQLIWITEANGNASFFNQRWYEYTGLNKEDSLFWGWQLVIHPEDLQNTLIEWQHSLQSGNTYQVEYRLRQHDGTYRWFMGRGMPMKDTKGSILKWYGFCADIHEQKQNRTELAERAQELQLLNQMIPQIVWSTTAEGTHDYFNQRWYQFTGLSFEQSVNEGWLRVLHPEDYERTLELWSHSLRTGDNYQIEYRFRRHDGTYRWFIARATPQKNTAGHIIKWFGTCTDIHDQKLQNEAFAQKNYELQQINAYLDQFVHTAAHDLRSPVANMKLLYDMLMREENPEKRKKLLDTFKPLLNRLDNTIIGLVEIVQMQEGHSALRVQEVNPLQVLHEVQEELAGKLEEANAQLDVHIEQEKPLYYLKAYLLSMLRNLISNSIKYRRPDTPLQIRVSGEWKGKYYWMSVEDNGIGIDLQRNSKNLFRPFKRLTQKGEGLGIGLHMVQNMVRKNGGHIEVSSEPGMGSTFSLYLHPYDY